MSEKEKVKILDKDRTFVAALEALQASVDLEDVEEGQKKLASDMLTLAVRTYRGDMRKGVHKNVWIAISNLVRFNPAKNMMKENDNITKAMIEKAVGPVLRNNAAHEFMKNMGVLNIVQTERKEGYWTFILKMWNGRLLHLDISRFEVGSTTKKKRIEDGIAEALCLPYAFTRVALVANEGKSEEELKKDEPIPLMEEGMKAVSTSIEDEKLPEQLPPQTSNTNVTFDQLDPTLQDKIRQDIGEENLLRRPMLPHEIAEQRAKELGHEVTECIPHEGGNAPPINPGTDIFFLNTPSLCPEVFVDESTTAISIKLGTEDIGFEFTKPGVEFDALALSLDSGHLQVAEEAQIAKPNDAVLSMWLSAFLVDLQGIYEFDAVFDHRKVISDAEGNVTDHAVYRAVNQQYSTEFNVDVTITYNALSGKTTWVVNKVYSNFDTAELNASVILGAEVCLHREAMPETTGIQSLPMPKFDRGETPSMQQLDEFGKPYPSETESDESITVTVVDEQKSVSEFLGEWTEQINAGKGEVYSGIYPSKVGDLDAAPATNIDGSFTVNVSFEEIKEKGSDVEPNGNNTEEGHF